MIISAPIIASAGFILLTREIKPVDTAPFTFEFLPLRLSVMPFCAGLFAGTRVGLGFPLPASGFCVICGEEGLVRTNKKNNNRPL